MEPRVVFSGAAALCFRDIGAWDRKPIMEGKEVLFI
jgi:hypothetical protein